MKFNYKKHRKEIQIICCILGIITSIAAVLWCKNDKGFCIPLLFVIAIFLICFERQIFEFNASFVVYDYKNAAPSEWEEIGSQIIYWLIIGGSWYTTYRYIMENV